MDPFLRENQGFDRFACSRAKKFTKTLPCRAQPWTTRLLPALGSFTFPSCCPGMKLPWIPPCLEGISEFSSSHQIPKPALQQDQSSAQTGKCTFAGHETTPAKLRGNRGDYTKEKMENGNLQNRPAEITGSKPGKNTQLSPKKERKKTALRYFRDFSSLPEEAVEVRGSPWLHGKLRDVKKTQKVFLEKAGEARHVGN